MKAGPSLPPCPINKGLPSPQLVLLVFSGSQHSTIRTFLCLFCLSVLPRDFQTLMCIKIAKEGCVRKSTHAQFERSTCVILTVPYLGPKPCTRYQQSVKNRAPGNIRAESGFRCPNMSTWIQITWYNSCQKMPISWFYLRCSQPEFLEMGPENVCNKLPKGL